MNKRDYYLGNRIYKGVPRGHLLCLINKNYVFPGDTNYMYGDKVCL